MKDASGHDPTHPGGRRHPLTWNGRTQFMSQWADERGISRKTFTSKFDRAVKDGMSEAAAVEHAMTAKVRDHSTDEEREERRDDVLELIRSMEHPVTVRQVYYRATVKGYVKKTESGYKTIGKIITELRESETIDWDWVVDNTRRVIEYDWFKTRAEALRYCAQNFTLDPWHDAKMSVAIWMEKDALAGVLETITLGLGVPLFVLKGFGSLSFIKKAAERFNEADRPVYCYHLGDFDPSGRGACETLERRLNQFCTVPLRFKSLALDLDQIEDQVFGELPSRETKVSDTRLEWFVRKYSKDRRVATLDRDLAGMTKDEKKAHLLDLSPESVELDAIEPGLLRRLVRGAIMKHTSTKRIAAHKSEEDEISQELFDIATEK